MSHIYPARTADTSLTTGTGYVAVSGVAPAANMRTFNQVLAFGDTVYLGVVHRDKAEWEEGLYTYVGTNRFARTQILQSSAGGGVIDFSAGIKDVFATIPSVTVALADANVTNLGLTTVDFGAWPGSPDASAVINTSAIYAGAVVLAQVFNADSADHTADEHWADPPIVTAGEVVAGTSFTIRALARDGDLYGKYNVSYAWK